MRMSTLAAIFEVQKPQECCGSSAILLRKPQSGGAPCTFPISRIGNQTNVGNCTLIRIQTRPKVTTLAFDALGESMAFPQVGDALSRESLKAALRAIRKLRRLRAIDAAERLGMPLRSYEHFESGVGQLNLERLFQFAEATDSDGWAILLAAHLGKPELAVRCADNKLVTILMLTLQDFDDDLGDGLADLEAAALIAGFGAAFRDLANYARQRKSDAQAFLRRTRPDDGGEP